MSALRDHAWKTVDEHRTRLCLTDEQAAYLAGIIDGEGNVGYRRRQKTVNVPIYDAYVGIGNTNLLLKDWLSEHVKTGVFVDVPRPDQPTWKAYFTVQWTGPSAFALLERVFPWLVLKRKQAQWVLGVCSAERNLLAENGRSRFSKRFPVPSWVLFQRETVVNAISELNRRGRAA